MTEELPRSCFFQPTVGEKDSNSNQCVIVFRVFCLYNEDVATKYKFEVNNMKMKLNEQIAFLRRQKEMTQEELAKALNVTNQAVSKWEAGACCPDISLLPELAEIFEVSVDALLGHVPTETPQDILLSLREKIELLPQKERYAFAFRVAAGLHAMLFSKEMVKNKFPGGWDIDEVIMRAGKGEWGCSCLDVTPFTTVMRDGVVLFADDRALHLTNGEMRKIAMHMKIFSDVKNIQVAYALYVLTFREETLYASIEKIAQKAELAEEKVKEVLEDGLAPFIAENTAGAFRFNGEHMRILPQLAMFDLK